MSIHLSSTETTRRSPGPTPLGAAARDIAAVSAGVVPFGLMLGITVVATGTGRLAGLVGAALVYGGSAQLTTITLLHLGTGLVAAVLSGAVVNARILLYGAALQPYFRAEPMWFRLLAPHFIQDQTYLSTVNRSGFRPEDFRRYWALLGGLLLAVWTGSVALGLVVAPLLPPLPHLGLVGTALFISMLVPRLVRRSAVVAASSAAGAAVLVAQLVPALGILGGALVGVLAAMVTTPRTAS
jgi:predicted branched-subunit amino acid permease